MSRLAHPQAEQRPSQGTRKVRDEPCCCTLYTMWAKEVRYVLTPE